MPEPMAEGSAEGLIEATDVQALVEQLSADDSPSTREAVADALVRFAAIEPRVQVKHGLLSRAGALLAGDVDVERALYLQREAFRLFPTAELGERLIAALRDDESWSRLGRLAALVDATAALHPEGPERAEAICAAVEHHLERGHGERAERMAEHLRALGDERADDLLEMAAVQIAARDEQLAEKRHEIARADEAGRGALLFDYAKLLLAGDAPLLDASAVLGDAVETGAASADVAKLWVEVARAANDAEALPLALSAALQAAAEPAERLRLADELASLPDVDATEPEVARNALAVLADALPDDESIGERLLMVRARLGDERVAGTLEQRRDEAARSRDRERETELTLALAVLATQRGDAKAADKLFRRVRTLQPRNREAFDHFERQYRASGDHQRLYLALTQRLSLAPAAERAAIATEMAQLAEGPLDAPSRALEAWQRVLEAAPNHPDGLDGLYRVHVRAGRHGDALEVLDRRIEQLAQVAGEMDEARRDLLERLGWFADLHGRAGGLADATAERAALQRLVEAAGVDQVAVARLQRLAALQRAEGAHEALASSLEALVARDAADDERAVRLELADLYEGPLDRAAAALPHLEHLARGTADGPLFERLAGLYEERGDSLGRYGLIRLRLEGSEGDDRIRLLRDAAEAALVLDQPSEAIAHYEALRAAGGATQDDLDVLLGLYGEYAPDSEGREEVLRERAADTSLDDGVRIATLEALLTLVADVRRDLERAAPLAEQLAALDADALLAKRVLQEVRLAAGDFGGLRALCGEGRDGAQEYADALAEAIPALARAAQPAGWSALADVRADELDDVPGALVAARRALAASDGQGDDIVTEHAERVLRYAEAVGDTASLDAALDELVRRTTGDSQRRWLTRRAEAFDERGDADGAYHALLEAVTSALAEEAWAAIGPLVDDLLAAAESTDHSGDLALLLTEWSHELELSAEADKAAGTACAHVSIAAASTALAEGLDATLALHAIDRAEARGAGPTDIAALRVAALRQGPPSEALATALGGLAGLLDGDLASETWAEAATMLVRLAPGDERARAWWRHALEAASTETARASRWDAWLASDDGAVPDELRPVAKSALGGSLPARTAARLLERLAPSSAAAAIDEELAAALGQVLGAQESDADVGAVLDAWLPALRSAATPESTVRAALDAARRLGRSEDAGALIEALAGSAEPGSEAHAGLVAAQVEIALASGDRAAAAAALESWTTAGATLAAVEQSARDLAVAAAEHGEHDIASAQWRRLAELADETARTAGEGTGASTGAQASADEAREARQAAWAMAAQSAEDAGDHAGAGTATARLAALADDEDSRVGLTLAAAEHLNAAGDEEALAKLLAEAVGAFPGNAALHDGELRLVGERWSDVQRQAHAERGWRTVFLEDAEQRRQWAEIAVQLAADAGDAEAYLQLVRAITDAGVRSEVLEGAWEVLSGSEDAAVADEAFSVLATLLRERGDEPQALLAELGGQRAIEARGDTVAARAVSALAARLEEAGQTAQAAERRTRAFALAPDVQGASALLAAATDGAAREATFGQVAEAAAALADAPAARALRMWIVEQRYASESLAAAVELLDAMLATDPDDEEARQMRGAALMSLEGADAASALDRHLAEAIARATEPADRLAAVLQRADVQHARLHNPAAALATLADAVGAAPDDLADSVREAGLALLGTESFDEPAAHATLRDWAVALAGRDGATAETRQAAVDHARLVAELRGEADDVDRLVASLLRADRPDDAALELEARAHAAPEEAATRLRAALALWAGDADDVARALGVLDQLRLLPGDHDDDALDEQALALIERLPAAEQAGQLAKLVERASRTTDEPRKARLQAALRRARASTGDADAIAALVTNAPQRDAPADAVDEALQAAQSGGQLGAWVDAVTALVSAPELDEELATALTAKAADIATAELGDPARAAAAWQARWQRSPEDLDAAQMAIAMWRELGETDAVEALLEATAPLQPADEAAPAWLELALLRGTDRGDDAWAALQQAGDVAVIEPRAVTLGVALTAAGTIEDASWLIRAGEQASWVDIEAQCGAALDVAELSAPARATLLDVITHARLGPLHQRDRGVEAAREALATQPTLARWERFMSASKGAVGEVRKALEALAPRADLPLDVARHAAAAADDVGADSLAEPLLRAVVAADVDDDEAFARLDAQLERASRFDELIDTLLARDTALAQRVDAATADDDRETTKLRRAALLHRAGGVALAQGARDLALDAYGRILALFPDDLDAHEGRVEVLRAQADDATLGGALQELAKRLPMGRARSEAFTEAARRVASAGDDEASHALYRAAFEADPANDEAFTMLERAAGEDTRELHKLLRHRAAGVEPGPQQTLVLRKLATVLRAMDRDEDAAATLRKALSDDPTNERVVDELRDLYRELGMVMPLLELVAARLRERATPQRRRALAKQAFDVAMGGGKLPAEARPLLEAIARAADGVDAKRISALFATTAGDARAAARGLEELIEHAESDEKQDELLERLVKLYARELPDDPGIVRTLQRVLRRSPARLDVHRRLAEVYLSRRSFEALLPTVERWAKHTGTDGDRALMLAYRAAATRGLGRQAEAFELLDEAWALDESQPEVAAQLADAHAARGAYVEAAAMMATAVALWQNREQTNAIPGAAARAAVYFLEAGDEDTALDFADRACAAAPDDASARLARGAVYTALDRLDDAFADLQRVAEGTDGSESQRADAFSGMARCAYLRGDTKAARPLIDRALALVPEHHAARELLKALS